MEVRALAMKGLVIDIQEFRLYLQGHWELLKGSCGGDSHVKSLKCSYGATEGCCISCRG